MNPRIERISAEIEKLREKITSGQSRLRELERLKTELENNDIIAAVRGVDIAPDELAAFVRMFKEQHGSVLPDIAVGEDNISAATAYAADQNEDTAVNRHNADKNQNEKEDK